jgi:hypothetical protein
MIGIDFVHRKENKNLIIFVHGFTGSKETWKNSKDEYFSEMLLKNTEIEKNYDIAYFNYYTRFIEMFNNKFGNLVFKALFKRGAKKPRKNLDINELAEFMGSIIRYNCSNYDNIIIIAHSMGGLISKSYILNEIKENGNTQVKLFLSLAVPHSGTNLATLAQLINIKNIQVSDLAPLTDTTSKLTRDWINSEHPKTIYFIGQYDEVVEKVSAIAFDANKPDIVNCDESHTSISKPESTTDLVYVSTQKILLEFLEQQNLFKNMTVKKYNDDGRYNEELFVVKLIVADIDKTLINGAKQQFFNAEYVTKILNKKQADCLEELYAKIKDLYFLYYGKYISNKIEGSNALITSIHEKIREDTQLNISSEEYKKLFSKLDYMHKTGMLHQLANQEKEEIFWKKDCSDDIKKYVTERE